MNDLEMDMTFAAVIVLVIRGMIANNQNAAETEIDLNEFLPQDAVFNGVKMRVKFEVSSIESEMPMKVFYVEDDGHYAANSEDEFRAWYIEQFGDECKECVDELNEMSLDGMQKYMVLVSDEGEKQTLLQVLLDHVARNGNTVSMLSCES